MSKFQEPPSPNVTPWRICLFGVLRVASSNSQPPVTRFQTQATGSLLAYLAYHSLTGVALPREVAIEAIWPDVTPISARNRFKIALSALRTQFAIAPFDKADVFLGDTLNIALNPALFSIDVCIFEAAIKRASRTMDRAERVILLDAAIDEYTGDLLMGRYDSWIAVEQDRLRHRHEAAVRERAKLWAILSAVPCQENSDIVKLTAAIKLPHVPPTHTRLFGRDGEIARLCGLLTTAAIGEGSASTSPLITLTGIGGIGKSRLATETAQRVLDGFRQRVWFVELADVMDPRQIWVQLRDALGLTKNSEGTAPEQVIAFLSSGPALIVFDNMEQFVASGHAVQFINSLRARLPDLACLVTSRHVIGAYGEQILPLGSLLDVADWSDASAPSSPKSCIEMFADRARAVRASFEITEENSTIVRQLCQRLDGIPLAIELAAARLNFLTPSQLLAQLEQRFALLKSTRRDIPDRHRSLEAAVETSYQLLSPELQRIFRALSVFRGGWTLEAAAAVCGLATGALWDDLTELYERSLVISGGDDATVRFRMLDTLRDYAAAQLHITPNDEEGAVWQRHRQHFEWFAAQAEPHCVAGAVVQQPWLDKIEADHENLRAAFLEPASDADNLLLATRLHRFWFLRGYASEGKRRLDGFLGAVSDLPRPDSAKAWLAAGTLAWAAGSLIDAQAHWTAALAIYREGNDERAMASVLNNLGIVACQNGYFDESCRYYTESRDLYRSLNDTVHQSMVLTNLGGVRFYQEDFDAAREALEEGLQFQLAAGDQVSALRSFHTLASISVRQGDFPNAIDTLCKSLDIRREIGDKTTLWEPLLTAANILSQQDKLRDAAVVWNAAQPLRERDNTTAFASDVNEEHELQTRLAALENLADAVEVGRAMGAERALAFACDALRKARAPTEQ